MLSLICIVFVSVVSAHPGRTASDGCHFCRTNCDTWGYTYNTRHGHQGQVCDSSIGHVDPLYLSPIPTLTPAPTPKQTYTDVIVTPEMTIAPPVISTIEPTAEPIIEPTIESVIGPTVELIVEPMIMPKITPTIIPTVILKEKPVVKSQATAVPNVTMIKQELE